MSTIKVTNLRGRNGSPTLPDGAVVTGVATATTFNGTLDGSLKTTGTPTLGLGVTINASGISVSGVLTATTFKGDGSNLTGVGESIAPWYYNPSVNDSLTSSDPGIGVTFNKRILAGSGTATLKIVNAGAAGTTIQSWGVSSCTFDGSVFTMGSLVSNLTINQTYQLDIPSGFIVDSGAKEYTGTAYTFSVQDAQKKLWGWGHGSNGPLAQNNVVQYSSPVQIPGTWDDSVGYLGEGYFRNSYQNYAIKQDGTLWAWGDGANGRLAQNNTTKYSSPVQIPGTTWKNVSKCYLGAIATKTNGTLWVWGENSEGQGGQNNTTQRSSPVQIPGTNWSYAVGGLYYNLGLKTDGTLWSWGNGTNGRLGLNSNVKYSSPVQIPGTTWTNKLTAAYAVMGIKTDGTLWSWGSNTYGALGLNQPDNLKLSSPTQVPGTTWSTISSGWAGNTFALKTDGTAWAWGDARKGGLGLNDTTQRSSPVQLGSGTDWAKAHASEYGGGGLKTDGTMWVMGSNNYGQMGQNNRSEYSSPIQIPGTEWKNMSPYGIGWLAVQDDQSP